MRQVDLPLIPDSAIDLGRCFSVFFEKEHVTWFHGLNVINRHRRDDQSEYRLEIARFCANGSVKQSAMARATGLHKNTVMSYVGRLLSCGGSSFYCAPPVRGGAVLVDEKLRECQELLGQGRSRSETARIAGVKKNTLEKAIRDGRLTQPRARRWQDGSQPADRKGASLAAAPLMGMGCNEKFKGLEPTRKLLMDTIRMVAYRAETAMASMADDFLSAPDTARSWMKALMKSPADIIPDDSAKTINVIIYPPGEERMNRMVRQLLQALNETMTVFPGTDMVLNYSLLT